VNFTEMLNAVYYTSGGEGVWHRHFKRLQKFNLEDRKKFFKKIMRQFGPNTMRIFDEELLRKDYFLSKIAKSESWQGGEIVIPFHFEPGTPEQIAEWEAREAKRPVELQEDERYIYLDGRRYEGPLRRAVIKRMGFQELKDLAKKLADEGAEFGP
jgi:hypothetical protein